MTHECVILPWPATPVLTVIDGTMDKEMEMLLPHVCEYYINVSVLRSTALPVTHVFSPSGRFLHWGARFSWI